MRPSVAERSIAAEVRATEEGHQARLLPGGAVSIVSDSDPSKHYRVEFVAVGDLVRTVCDHPVVLGLSEKPSMGTGIASCKHGARALQRLEREGVAQWRDGWWRPTAKGLRLGREAERKRAKTAPAEWYVD